MSGRFAPTAAVCPRRCIFANDSSEAVTAN
jgi:hypothetical protein